MMVKSEPHMSQAKVVVNESDDSKRRMEGVSRADTTQRGYTMLQQKSPKVGVQVSKRMCPKECKGWAKGASACVRWS